MASSPYDNWVSNPAEDHGPLMSITFWTLTGLAFVFLFVRLWIRHHQGKLWIDDLLLTISWFLLLAQGVLNQLAINLGFGKHVLDINFDNAESIAYYGASGLAVSICAITLSKISFGVTLLRLTEKWPRMWVYFAMASLAVCAIPLTVMPFVQCTPIAKTFVDLLPGKCINKNPSIYYARFQGVWAALMDWSLALLPWKILWGLQMRFTERVGVCVAMSLGLLTGCASILRARYIDLLTEQDLSYDAYNSIIWAAADTAMTIIATSMPVLRVIVTKAVSSAIETYQHSSRNKSRNDNSTTRSKGGNLSSLRQSSKKTTDTLQSSTRDFLDDRVGKDSKGYLELEEIDLVVDERTGRITAATPESIPDAAEHKVTEWPLER